MNLAPDYLKKRRTKQHIIHQIKEAAPVFLIVCVVFAIPLTFYNFNTSQEATSMTTASAEMVSAIDPTGKDLTAMTAQIKETKVLLAVLEGKQEELKKGVILRVGQVWHNESSNDNNPFEKKDSPVTYEITALKDGYVEYKFIMEGKGFSMQSETIRCFTEYSAGTLISE